MRDFLLEVMSCGSRCAQAALPEDAGCNWLICLM